MIPFPLHLEIVQSCRPQSSIERELAAIEARMARRPSRPPWWRRLVPPELTSTLRAT